MTSNWINLLADNIPSYKVFFNFEIILIYINFIINISHTQTQVPMV